ncbi:DUF1153 domain-containing protein [Pseudoruegeria sp. SK021]|uniref:CtrA inhibitor SciP n=1 Tax=Pseudoruegeria sp. SK021 TaxID=1933035 RepID=UPI000A22898C|nr:DUF1153 domain-containing protein [Pseudoruegeria sp. SK021]OSP55464.1 hypothetical protein BV911_07405 [Pseudoruegeria sp. SK021]
MYIKKIDGPRLVSLPDGTTLTRADLPAEDTIRWVASRKAVVVKAVKHGLITRDEAKSKYQLSDDELDSWSIAVDTHGESALKTTALQRYRQV